MDHTVRQHLVSTYSKSSLYPINYPVYILYTHQQTPTVFSPCLDSPLTSSLFLAVTQSLPYSYLHYLCFAAKPFSQFFLIHLEKSRFFPPLLALLGGRKLKVSYVFFFCILCKPLLLLSKLKKSASGIKTTCILLLDDFSTKYIHTILVDVIHFSVVCNA